MLQGFDKRNLTAATQSCYLQAVMVQAFLYRATVLTALFVFNLQVGLCADPGGKQACVLLSNQNVLFGNAQQRGEFVMVRRDDGSELQLKRQEVLCWANSIEDLYRYRVDHRHPSDVMARLDDVRWCLRYDLLHLASNDLNEIQRIEPGNQAAYRLWDQLRRRLAAKSAPTVADPTRPSVAVSKVELASHQEQELNPEIDPAMLKAFARHVQPILLNRCGGCHSHHADRKWTLVVPTTGSRASGRMAKANLAATLKFVDRQSPENSALRLRAIDGHAGRQAALGSRNGSALAAVDHWLRSTTTDQNNQANRHVTVAVHEQPIKEADVEQSFDEPIDTRPAGVRRLPTVKNPFDPELFNKEVHGAKSP